MLVDTGRRCCICGELRPVQLHHIVPKKNGGTDDIKNAIPLCPNCHDEVHSGYAPGRNTKIFTVVELKGHRQKAIDRQKATPAGTPAPSMKVFHVSQPHNPNFTGRAEILESLCASLASGKATALTAISGGGGFGKTQIAVEYCYRHAAEYDLVWWVKSETTVFIVDDYIELAEKLGSPVGDEKDADAVVENVKQLLAKTPRWLLVFDNAPGPAEIAKYLPRSKHGSVIITSRDPAFRGVAETLDIDVMNIDEAVAFLIKRTGLKDKDAARELAEALGRLPLALEQAGAYIDGTRNDFSGYLDIYKKKGVELFKEKFKPSNYDYTVATTWELSFREIEKTLPEAAEFLNLIAFFAPDDIPIDVIGQGVEFLPESFAGYIKDNEMFDELIAALIRFSLVKRSGKCVSIHRLVQEVTRNRLDEDSKKKWAQAAVEILNKAFPFESGDVRTWSECSRLLPHSLIAANFSEVLDVANDATGRILNQIGLHFRGRAQFPEAKSAFERSLRMGEKTLGPDHPTVAIRVNNLGMVLQDMGDFPGAKAHYERALKIDEKAYGPAHPSVAIDVNNLGSVLYNMGDLQDAKEHFERALRIDEKVYGPDHPTVAIDVNNLGMVLKDMGDLKGAKEHFERALRIDEKALGPDHPSVARDVNNLGSVLQATGDLEGAKEKSERAYAILVKCYGENHPLTVKAQRNLELLSKRGR